MGFLDRILGSQVTHELGRISYTHLVIIELVRSNPKQRDQNVKFVNLLRYLDV